MNKLHNIKDRREFAKVLSISLNEYNGWASPSNTVK